MLYNVSGGIFWLGECYMIILTGRKIPTQGKQTQSYSGGVLYSI